MADRAKTTDDYIANAAEFAQPILKHLRKIVKKACPEVEEAIKWQFPTFSYKGMLCSMAAFKEHATFGFWKHDLLEKELGDAASRDAMGSLGRITSLDDLPKDADLIRWIKAAMKLNDAGVKSPRRAKKPSEARELAVPPELTAALKRSAKARATFEAFSYSKKKDYVEWITEAKTDETRDRRLAQAIEWMADGKSRNWKYEKC